ncbi:hypothetical protein GS458_0225 [Geobacillus stearothermophilus]|nr:hypothetical protein GS458_0225 [Geobacillus stearothermophilus]
MKNRWLWLLIAVWLSGCQSGDIQPPDLRLAVDGETIDHRLGTYTWSTGGRGVVADTAAPPLLVKNMNPHPVAPGAKLHLQFDDLPLTIEAGVWNGGDADWRPVQNGIITLPEKKGAYIYAIHASWKKGNAIYAFFIEVR